MRLRVGRRVFAPGRAALLLAALGVALFTSLGRWQLHRAEEKRELIAAFARGDVATVPLSASLARVPRYQRVRVQGRYDATHQILLDNITLDGRVGYYALTPLLRADGTTVVVNRGWLPLGSRREALPDLSVGGSLREVEGRMDEFPRAGLSLPATAGTSWPRVLNFPDAATVSGLLGGHVHPQLLLLDASRPDGFRRNWRPAGLEPERHVGYAVQWFAFAATTVILLLLLNLRRLEPPT